MKSQKNREQLISQYFIEPKLVWFNLAANLALLFQFFAKSPQLFNGRDISSPSVVEKGMILVDSLKFACLGCGFTESYTPKMLLVSLGFVIVPASIVIFIFLKLRADAAARKRKSIDSDLQ